MLGKSDILGEGGIGTGVGVGTGVAVGGGGAEAAEHLAEHGSVSDRDYIGVGSVEVSAEAGTGAGCGYYWVADEKCSP